MNNKLSLAKKVLLVSESIGHVEKNGLNQHFKFRYQAWEDVLPAVRNACVEHGVQITPNIMSVKQDGQHVVVQMTFTVKDADSDQVDEFVWYGEAKGNDDKLIQKAITSATKYALLKYLMIPIIDDTDNDGDVPQKAKAKAKSEPTTVTVEDVRKINSQQVFAQFKQCGGTIEQIDDLKLFIKSKSLKITALQLIADAIDNHCESIEAIHLYCVDVLKHPHPFRIE